MNYFKDTFTNWGFFGNEKVNSGSGFFPNIKLLSKPNPREEGVERSVRISYETSVNELALCQTGEVITNTIADTIAL